MKQKAGIFFLFCGVLWLPFSVLAQQTTISGVIRDGKTKAKVPFAHVFFKGTQVGVTSDLQGRYSITTNQPYTHLQFSCVGYEPTEKILQHGVDQTIDIRLQPNLKLLKEIVVTSAKIKERYRNKDNPAVALIRNVIKNKAKNYMEHYDYLEYEEYEKLGMSMSSKIGNLKKSKLYNRYPFFFKNRDTTTLEGFALLPIYMQETLSKNYFRQEPKKWKKIIEAHKKTKFDDFFDTDGVGEYLDQLYQNIDIYNANIALLGQRFLSPISDLAPSFYKFYMTDTVEIDGEKLYELLFVPRNDTDFLFQGSLYITVDNRYAVQHVDMMVNKNINLNWVRSLKVIQAFEKSLDNRYYLVKGTIAINFSVTGQSGGFYGERTTSLKNFIINRSLPDSVYAGETEVDMSTPTQDSADFWVQHRHDTLNTLETKAYIVADSVQKVPSFRRAAKLMVLLLSGYQEFRVWELGPIGTFFGGNPIEGFRLRVGGRTTSALHKHIYFKSYLSYGFRDTQWKYYLEGTYSFSGTSPIQFPIRALQLSYQREMKAPGQELEFVQENNFLLSIRRGKNDKWLYNNVWKISYQHEFKNHLSFSVGLKHLTQEPTGSIVFTVADRPSPAVIPSVKTFETQLKIRWAPKEKFFQGKKHRSTIRNKYPIITARLVSGIKNVLGSQYDYHNLNLVVQKRLYLSQIGFTDITLEGGYTFGKVPFPFLKIHRANQTYSYRINSYNLMNFLEFVSDHYVSLQINHHFNGFFLNKIPLLKKLKLREMLSFKMLYGGIRNENIPSDNNSLFQFLRTPDGVLETYTLERVPYMEVSLGVENIFNFLRIDVVRRLSYLNNPNVAEWGIRGIIRFHF